MSIDLKINNSSLIESTNSSYEGSNISNVVENISGLINKIDSFSSFNIPGFDQNFTRFQFTVSIASCLICLFLFTITIWRKKDIKKRKNNLKLNEAIVQLESTIKNINFENQAFMNKIIDLEKEVEDVRKEKTELNEKLLHIEKINSENEKRQRDHSQKLNRDYSILEAKFENLLVKERMMEQELGSLKEEKQRIELNLSSYEEYEKNSIEIEKYNKLQMKFDELNAENEIKKDELMKNKADFEGLKQEFENLSNDINERNKTLELLKSFIAKLVSSNNNNNNSLPTISEEGEEESEAGEQLAVSQNLDIMIIVKLEIKVHDLEQKLGNETQRRIDLERERDEYQQALEKEHKNYEYINKQYDETLVRMKRLESEIKISESLRFKDIELSIKKEAELETKLKKKSTDADRATHLLEQLRLKQERIQELEGRIERMERNATSDRASYEKQMNDIRITARKYEKECEEAKKEAESARKESKLWKEKYNEVDKYKEKLLRPVAFKHVSPPYMQPIIDPNDNQLNQSDESPSNEISPAESITEPERPISTSNNLTGFLSPMYPRTVAHNQALGQGISPTPMHHPMFRGLTPPMFRPYYPSAVQFLPVRMSASPEVMNQYMNSV